MLKEERGDERKEEKDYHPTDRKEAIKGFRSKKGPDFKKVVMVFGYSF